MKTPKSKHLKKTNWFDSIFINPTNPYLIIVIVGLALYAQVLSFGLVHFDDHGFVLLSADLLKLSNIPAFFKHSVFWVFGEANKDTDVYYRPLQNVVYAICNTISPKQAWSYHLAGVLFHVLTCCALFNFFTELNYRRSTSLLFSIIYCIHPVLVQGVAWIAGLGDQMATLFVLISFTWFIKLCRENKLNTKYLLIHLLAFIAALFSKEISLALIPLCLFYYFFINKNKSTTIALLSGLWVVLAAGFLFCRSNALTSGNTSFLTSAFDSFKINGVLIFGYIEKIFLPFRLNPMPPRNGAPFIMGLVILVALIIIFVVKKRFTVLSLLGAGWFFAFILPTFIQVNTKADFYSFEHRLYLPLIGMLIAQMELVKANHVNLNSKWYKYGFVVLFFILFTVAFSYSRTFKDAYGFHDRVIQLSPKSSLIYNGYAELLLEDKKYERAIEMYKKSFEFTPTDLNTSGKIADIYLRNLNDAPDAIKWWQKTLEVSPKTVEAAVSIGDAYFNSLNDTTNAIVWYNKALNISPTNEFALAKLGVIEVNKGHLTEARKYLLQALKQDDKNLLAYTWMAISYFNEGHIEGAVPYLNKAYDYYPNDADVQRNLLICYYKLNNPAMTKKFAAVYSANGGQIPAEITGYLQGK